MSRGEAGRTINAAFIDRLLGRLGRATTAVSLASVLFVITAFYFLQVRPQAEATVKARQKEAAERVVNRIEGLVGEIENLLLTSQRWAADGLISLDDPVAFNRLMLPVLQLRRTISSFHLASDAGREVLLLGSADGFRNRITDVPGKGHLQQWLNWHDVHTRSGEELKEQDYDPRRRPWFSGALETPEGRVHWTAPYLFQTTREPGITASVRWIDKASGRQFVVAMDILLSDLSRSTRELEYGGTGMVALLTDDGKLLGLPRNAGFDNDEAIQKAVLQPPEAIGLQRLAAVLRQAGAASDGTRRLIDGGEPWLATLQRAPFGNQVFRIAMLAPEGDFSPWSRQIVLILLLLLAMVAVLSALLARRLARDVSRPLAHVFDELAASNLELKIQGGHSAAIATLAPKLQNAGDFAALADTLLGGLADRMMLGQGSLYRVDTAPETLRLCGGFARGGAGTPPATIAFGEGLVGQCAIERQAIALADPPSGYLRVGSALTAGDPALILVLPVVNNEQLLGVLELALLKDGGPHDRGLIDRLLPVLALCMEVLARSARAGELLRASQAQAAELAAQQERIQAMFAEQSAIFENAPMSILYAADGRLLRTNAALAALLGRSERDLAGADTALLFASPASHHKFAAAVTPMLAAGNGVRLEWTLAKADGSCFDALLSGRGVTLPGIVQASIWVIEDISERKRNEAAISASEARLRLVIEDSPTAVMMVSAHGEQLFTNRRLAELLGLPPSQLQARRSSEFWADPQEREHFIARLQAEGRVDRYETRFRRADGRVFPVLLDSRWIEQDGQQLLLSWISLPAESTEAGAGA